MAGRHGLQGLWNEEARQAAILWCRQKGDNSGRIALQFANHWVGSCMMQHKQG
jgi:hypothetical protein